MKKEFSITEFAARYNRGEFDSPSQTVQIEAGWYDWFCNSYALCKKTKKLAPKVLSIMDSPKFDNDKTYVFFKNNCPFVGPLYDQFSICDMESGNVLFCCQHLEKGSHGCDQAHWEIYARVNGFENPVVKGTWKDCKKWFFEK